MKLIDSTSLAVLLYLCIHNNIVAGNKVDLISAVSHNHRSFGIV